MELQFKSETCRCLTAAVREVRSAELTQEVRLTDGMPDIGRVVASWGQIVLRSKEWQRDQVCVSGGIMVWTLYVPEDGTQPRCVDTWMPFQLKWELSGENREGPIRVCPLLRFVDSRCVSVRKIMVRASLAALGEALSPMSAEVYAPTELPDDIQVLQNTYPIRLPKEAGEKTFLIDEDLSLPAGAAEIEKLLAYTMEPQLQEKRVAGDKVILRGIGKLHMVYRCPEGKIHGADLEMAISQYAQLEEIYGTEALADVLMGITSLELTQGEGNQLRLKCGMVAQYLISDRFLAELTEDAYSPQRDVELQMADLELPVMLENRAENISVRQQLPGVTGETADLTFLPDFPRQSRNGDKVMLDLTGQFQVIYYAPDGSLQGSMARWEENMQLPADPAANMVFLVQMQNAQAIAGMDEMSLSGQYVLQLHTFAAQGMPMVTGLEIGPERERDPARPSLILCRPDGETLWEMAKRTGSTVADIRRANNLTAEKQENRMLLIPVE